RLAPVELPAHDPRDLPDTSEFLRQEVRQPPDAEVGFAVAGRERAGSGLEHACADGFELVLSAGELPDTGSLEHVRVREPRDRDRVPAGAIGAPVDGALRAAADGE